MACVLALAVVAIAIGLGWVIGGLRFKRLEKPPSTFEPDEKKTGVEEMW